MSDFAPIAGTIAQLVRFLGRSGDGEVLAAVEAIKRKLQSAGLGIHDLADFIERPIEKPKGVSEADMKRIYDTGFRAGLEAAEKKHHGGNDFVNVNGLPSWHEIALYCQRNNHRLNDWEREFIDSVASQTAWREPRPKQEKCLRSIFYKLGGKL